MKLLKNILRYKRPHGTTTEHAFINRFIDCLPGMTRDKVGNRILQIGNSPIMWSCHTDTVHRTEGLQKVFYQKNMLKSNSNCLGADDGAGVCLMIKMIRQKVPGLYIFHRGEECGGIGSRYITTHTPELVKDIKFAIAMDRKGYTDLITHQGARCCSDAFGNSLAKELNMEYKLSDRGTFTDTANYTDIIGECTNLSVGYFSQHSIRETQDPKFLKRLLEALSNVNPDNLVGSREPGEIEPSKYGAYNYNYNNRSKFNYGGKYNSSYNKNTVNKNNVVTKYSAIDKRNGVNKVLTIENDDPWDKRFEDEEELEQLENMITLYPRATARLLRDYGITFDEIKEEAFGHYEY